MRYLTVEGKVDSGLFELMDGKRCAFVAVAQSDKRQVHGYGAWGLAVAEEGKPGYWAVPAYYCHGEDYDAMAAHADMLNEQLGLTYEEAALIVASSMRTISPLRGL